MFVVTPRFAPAYEAPQCNPFGGCAPASRAPYTHGLSRLQPRRPDYSAFNHFFSQVDELLGDMARDAQRKAQLEAHVEAHRQRQLQQLQQLQQLRQRSLRANFAVRQNDQGWQLDGDIQGFTPDNINIDIIDEHTLKVSGNTQWQSTKPSTQPETQQSVEQPREVASALETVATTDSHIAPDSDSESESHKSYQPTVEDDYEDLGADTSSLLSLSSGTSTPAEPKAKEEAIESSPEPLVARQSLPESPAQLQQPQQPGEQERLHGTFERTFRFPQRIDAARVSASFTDGALRIIIPKAQIPQVRRIAIM